MPAGGVAQRTVGGIKDRQHHGGGLERGPLGGEHFCPGEHGAEVRLGGEQLIQDGSQLATISIT